MNILLVEDNLGIVKGLKYSFSINNYNLEAVSTYSDAKNYIEDKRIDLIILDVTLPDGNGLSLYKNVIKNKKIPTIFLTAKDDEDDIVLGLESGADDYITKPFSTKELLARVKKILLRNHGNIIKIKDIKYDLDKMTIHKNNELIELSSLELKLLNLLFINIGKVVSRNTILEYIWEWTGNYVDDHTITVYFKRIREKIDSDIIITVKGVGYRIDEE